MSGKQIMALLAGLVGLGATIGATVSNEWKTTSRASSVITATWVFQGLWMNCAGNAIGSVHCRQHHTIFKLESYIQVCRGLMISAVCLGFFATACALVGMKCTKIGGSDQLKARLACFSGVQYFIAGPIQAVRALLIVGMFLGLFAAIFSFIGMDCTYIGGREKSKYKILILGTVLHFAGGVTCLAAYCLYTSRLGTVVFTRMHDARLLRYYIGLPVFFGLVGSPCIILGSVLYAVTLYSVLTANRKTDVYASRKYMAPKIYKAQKKGRTSHNRDDASRSSSKSSSQVSRTSLILADRDSFV
ncbi:claudin-10 isoform X2 [Ictalurus furcatus]|uniref:claudin-10 isoform X2 n=1 Tax=Ictalurus furcatus TaxID=66913 RepID=UPI0023507C12|nr:claudin-10 isoform X2 [Ictalurus furcatus]